MVKMLPGGLTHKTTKLNHIPNSGNTTESTTMTAEQQELQQVRNHSNRTAEDTHTHTQKKKLGKIFRMYS